MANSNPIIEGVYRRVLKTVQRDDVPVPGANTREVADAVAREIAPVIENATNQEPWYQSRIFRGLIVTGLGYLGSKVGLVIGESDVTIVIDAVATVVEALGILYATYGRIVGATKKPAGV